VFEWDDGNVGHIEWHRVLPHEAEQAVLDPERVPATAYRTTAERRWAILGATEEGRLLFVVFTRRSGLLRVVTARDVTLQERRRYRG
jgi:uncharacterized protein